MGIGPHRDGMAMQRNVDRRYRRDDGQRRDDQAKRMMHAYL
jgi:hypothetical protein